MRDTGQQHAHSSCSPPSSHTSPPCSHTSPPSSHTSHFSLGRKVYGILSLQILFTCAMCAVFMLVLPVRDWTVRNTWMMWVFFAATIITLFPMHKYKKTYPANMICLGESLAWRRACSRAHSALQSSSPCFRRTPSPSCAPYTPLPATLTQVRLLLIVIKLPLKT